MFKIVNLSNTHLSIEGENLAPRGYLNVESVDSNIRYLESKKAVSVTWIAPRPVAPAKTVVATYELNTSKRKLDSGRTK